MADPFAIPDMATHAPAVKYIVKHAAHVKSIQPIAYGVSMLTIFISSLVSAAIGGGLGWYIKGRGMAGVQVDLNNIKNDITHIKAHIGAPVAPSA